MTPSSPVARPVAARAAIASILVGIVTGCTGVAVSIPPASVEPSAIDVASASPPLPTPVAGRRLPDRAVRRHQRGPRPRRCGSEVPGGPGRHGRWRGSQPP